MISEFKQLFLIAFARIADLQQKLTDALSAPQASQAEIEEARAEAEKYKSMAESLQTQLDAANTEEAQENSEAAALLADIKKQLGVEDSQPTADPQPTAEQVAG